MMNPAWPKTILLTFLCFLVVGLLVGYSSLNSPFLWDDLHLIREHTPDELARVWTGTWDTDQIETPGFRPLTAYFNHFRALAFGESVAAHRLFLLLLFAVLLTMAGILARWLFAATFWQVVLGGLLGLLHLDSVYHYFWISDGVHLLAGILILGAILSFLRSLRSGHPVWLLVSFLCTLLALLSREDSLTAFPLLVWFGFAFLWMENDRGRAFSLPIAKQAAGKLSLGLFTAAMLMALAMYWNWRRVAVPGAASLTPNPAALLWAASHVVQNAGEYRDLIHPRPPYVIMVWLWYVWLGALVTVAALLLKRPQQRQVLFWAGASLIAALPTLQTARANLLLLPVMFWGFLVATVLAQLWRQSAVPALRLCAVGMTVFALAAPAYASLLFMQEQGPNNLGWLCEQATLIYYTPHGTIPHARLEDVQRQLDKYGISSGAVYQTQLQALARDARRSGHFGANLQGLPFIPRFDLIPNFPELWRCLPRSY